MLCHLNSEHFVKGGRSAPLSSRGRGSNVLKVCPKALKTNATQKFGARARNVLLRLVRVLLRGDAISAHFWSKVKKPIKVYSTKRWKPKSRSPRPVFIPRPRHLPFIYRGTRDGRSLKKKLQPLRRLTQKFRFFALSRLLVLSLVQPFSGGGRSSSESWLGVLFFVVGPSHIFIWRPRCFFFLIFRFEKKMIFKKRLFDFVIT